MHTLCNLYLTAYLLECIYHDFLMHTFSSTSNSYNNNKINKFKKNYLKKHGFLKHSKNVNFKVKKCSAIKIY